MKDIRHLCDELGTPLFIHQAEPFLALPVLLLGPDVHFYGSHAHGFHAFIVLCRFI